MAKRRLMQRISEWAQPTFDTEKKMAVLGSSDELGAFLAFGYDGSAATPSGAMSLYEDSTAVSVPINIVADHFSQIEPVLTFEDDHTRDHDVIRLLVRPSPDYTGTLFRETLGKNYLIAGETECVAMGGVTRPPSELQPINPRAVAAVEGKDGRLSALNVSGPTLTGNYVRDRKGGGVRFYQGTMLEAKMIRNYSTKNHSLLRGQSLLVSAAQEARQHILGGKHNVSLLEKGGRPTLVMHYASDGAIDEFEETKETINNTLGGYDNAGRIIVTTGGQLTVENLSSSNVDMDFGTLQGMARQAVALQYHVPLPLITTDATTLNNYQVALLALYDDAVLPLAGRIFGGLSDFLLPRYGLDPTRYRITYDPDQITALQARRVDELTKRVALNVESDNEIRQMLGREPYEGGDVILKPANLVPVGSDLFTDDDDLSKLTDKFKDEDAA
jgi:HK97 family phage portal protein